MMRRQPAVFFPRVKLPPVPPIRLSNLHPFVFANSRRRGEEYARAGAVMLLHRRSPADPVKAEVAGSALYDVVMRAEHDLLLAACSCPHFAREFEICKHIWATIVVCAERHVEFVVTPQDLIADDESDLDDEVPQLSHVSARKRWVPPSRWRSQIEQLNPPPSEQAATPVPEITWVLDPAPSGALLHLEMTTRSPKKNGEPGKPQPLRLAHAAVERLPPIDREIVSTLPSASFGYGIEPRLVIGWPAADYIVPKLVATGRLWVRLGKGEYAENPRFDEGAPWRLAARAAKEDGKFVLSATLRRGDESRPLSDALAVTRGGFVIFRDSIARFADEGTQRWASVLLSQTIEIPAREIDDFVRAVATAPSPLAIDFPKGVAWKERRVSFRARLDLEDSEFTLLAYGEPVFDYEGEIVSPFVRTRGVYREKTRTILLRDAAEEERKLAALWDAGFERRGESVAIPVRRLHAAAAALAEAGWEVRDRYGLHAPPGKLELSLRSGIDWFDLEGTLTFGSERVRLPRLLAALRKGESVLRLDDGRVGRIDAEWRAQLEPFLASASSEEEGALRFRGNQVLLLDALLAGRQSIAFDERFDQARRRILDVRVAPQQPPESFRGVLRPYQSEGLGWFSFLRELGFGGCLADDMGLGKTVQVLALLDERRRSADRRPSLVVVPRSLIFNWKAEAGRFTPELRLLDHSTPDRVRATDHFGDHDVVLTTYALLRKEAELFAGAEFDYVILDEAQAIKNPSSQAAKAAMLMRARHRLALTGTPVENHLGELASLFEFLNPGMLRARSGRVMAMLRDAGGRSPQAAEARSMLARAVRPFILRRTKKEVARELPERVEQTIYCELEPKQRRLYDELRDYYRASVLGRVATSGIGRSKIHILEALLRMRQAACHPGLVDRKRQLESSAKLDALFEELPVLVDEGHKVLVFSQFTSLLDIVRREVRQRGFAFAYIDGSTRDREEQVRRFQSDPGVPLFLISLKAGGLGLNLTAAEYVFLLDPWWNPAVEAQAIDRAHRIGQSQTVFAYRLVARDTIEEKILQLQQSKRDLADAIISEENSILRQLTAEDLDLLLS